MKVLLNRRSRWQVKGNTLVHKCWNSVVDNVKWLNDVVEITPADVWSVDCTICAIAVPLLKRLKLNNYGFGLVYDEDVPTELKTGNDEHNEDKYNWLIDEVIWALNEITNGELNAPVNNTPDWSTEYDAYEARIHRGTELFGKYLQTFWY